MKRRVRRKRANFKITIDPKYIYWALVVICLVLGFCSYKFKDTFAPFTSRVGDMITPMQQGIDSVGDRIAAKAKMFSNMEDLIAENAELKTKIDELKSENQLLTQEKYEFGWYIDLYDLDMKYDQYEKVAAKVISREPNSYCNVFIIDRGSDDGICKNMNVVSGNGLVGIVTDVGKKWAKVRSIIDDDSSISGMFLKTSDTCIVTGNLQLYDDGFINVSMIGLDAEVYENYEIVTSYISDKYLPGILIGYVSDIKTSPSTMAKEAYLTPVVDFNHIETVLVIKQLKEQYDDLLEVMSSDN